MQHEVLNLHSEKNMVLKKIKIKKNNKCCSVAHKEMICFARELVSESSNVATQALHYMLNEPLDNLFCEHGVWCEFVVQTWKGKRPPKDLLLNVQMCSLLPWSTQLMLNF